MTNIEIIGYGATVLNVVGNLMLTRFNLWGWIVRLLVNVLYVIYAAQIELGGPMVVNHVVFMAINIEGWRQWRLANRPPCDHRPDGKYACEFPLGHKGMHGTDSGKRWYGDDQRERLT